MKLRLTALTLVAALASAAQATAADLHVDCSAPVTGDGSVATPFNALGPGFDLGPGDRLLLRRGTTCEGLLRITGGGSSAQPAMIDGYGEGERPRVVGTSQDAVLIEDASNLTLTGLDLSNPGSAGPLGEGDQVRNGVRIVALSGPVTNLTVSGLEIHDVDGDLTKNPEGSAGIQVSATGPPPARFVDLSIRDNRISSVSRSGISITGTTDPDRPAADQPWPEASTGVVIEGNRIDLIAGDGIVPRGTDGAIVRDNVVSRGNLAGRPLLDPAGPMCNAGIWTFRSNNTLIRGNEVFGMEHNGCDGTGFDVDYRQDGTVIEGNYSHDNEGGFVLLCTDEETHRADVRFNLSVDDGTMINHGPCGLAEGILGDLSGIRMFNNTVVADSPTVSVQLGVQSEMYEPGDFLFRNNLVYARQPSARIPCGKGCSHNGFFNLPASGSDAVTADPLLTDGYRLTPNSPLRAAGTSIPAGAETDFFGNPVPAVPSIGFDQAPATIAPGPSRACLKARTARNRAQRKVKALNRRLRSLRQHQAGRSRIRTGVRRLRKARSAAKRQARAARRICSKAAPSGLFR